MELILVSLRFFMKQSYNSFYDVINIRKISFHITVIEYLYSFSFQNGICKFK